MKSGRSAEAEKVYAAAIKTFPGYHPAYAGLGKAQSAQDNVKAAIASYERAQASTPLPDYAAALYDLYHASGDEKNAEKERDLLDLYDHLSLANGEKANRNLAMAYADHDWHLDRALELTQAEIAMRKDIYTYDALAWALHKNHREEDAKSAMTQAMHLHARAHVLLPRPADRASLGRRQAGRRVRPATQIPKPGVPPMTAVMILALITRMQDPSLNVSQRNDACYELRGVAAPEAVKAMRAALADSEVRACAGLNLRAANAFLELQDAIADSDFEVRAIAARLLGSFEKPELLPAIAAAAHDPQLIVATNAVEGLANYRDREMVMPYLLDLAKNGGIVGTAALNRALTFDDPRTIAVARGLLGHSDVSDKLAAMRVLAHLGDATDLPVLTKIINDDTGAVAGQSRGFGFVPAVSLTRAAQTTIAAIEKRTGATASR